MKSTTIDPATTPPNPKDDKAPPTTTTPPINPTISDILNNKLIPKLLPSLNTSISTSIKSSGYDPWKNVVSGKDDLLVIDMFPPFDDIKFTASYSITNMTGLSSLIIDPITALSAVKPDGSQPADPSNKSQTITGNLSAKAKLNKDLVATITGTISASYGSDAANISISGKATAKGVTGSANGTYGATIGYPNSCLTALAITKNTFKLNYTSIVVDIKGDADIADTLLNPLIALINDVYGDEIKSSIAKALEDPLNSLLRDLLKTPLCLDVSPQKK